MEMIRNASSLRKRNHEHLTSLKIVGVGWDMTAISNRRDDVISKLVPGGALGLAHLSDEALLANTRRLVGKSNELLAALLAHLAEVEARGVHRTRRCSSLYTYCIYELRFSEDAAARRSSAARLVKQFPPLLDAIANGELHLTGLLLIGPHLTPDNHVAVLGRAKFRTKKELGKLVRDLNPLPQVPDRIEPLGPATLRALRNPTWEEYVTSLAPQIRELPLGERPCDWVDDADVATEVESLGGAHRTVARGAVVVETVATRSNAGTGDAPRMTNGAERATEGAGQLTKSAEQATETVLLPVGPIPRDLPPVTGPQHYQVQFSTIEEHAQLIERAKALLARSHPGVTLGELHLEAMKLLVASLEKRRFAVTSRPQRHAPARHRNESPTQKSGATHESKAISPPRQRGNETGKHQREREREREASDIAPLGGEETNMDAAAALYQRGDETADVSTPRQRGNETSKHQREREREASDIAPLGDEETNMDGAAALCQRGDETADVSTPRQRGNETSKHQRDAVDVAALDGEATNADAEWPRQRGGETSRREPEIVEIEESAEEGGDLVSPRRCGELGASRRSRYVPAVERREVYRRDDGRCTFVDTRGERCRETRYLELHHLQPFARNGGSVAANLALRCAAHNALAAEEDFGRRLVMAHRDSPRHEAFARQPLAILEEKD
jgi:hypothetical protein